jgi:hypothetical protein
MTKIDTQSVFEGDTITKIEKPKTRSQQITEWRMAHQKEYENACHEANCTCTPTRAQALIMEQYNHPPID